MLAFTFLKSAIIRKGDATHAGRAVFIFCVLLVLGLCVVVAEHLRCERERELAAEMRSISN